MISIESGPEGFTLVAAGRRLLSHSRRSPCVEIGSSENLVRQNHGATKLRRRRSVSRALRGFRILESSETLAVIDFEGKLELAVRWAEGRVRLSFTRFDSSINLFRLKLAACADEGIFGCGERFDRLDLKLSAVQLWVQENSASGGGATPFPVPAFISTKNYWCAIDSSAYTILDFRRAFTLIDSWAVPREIVMGFQEDAKSAVADMTSALGRPPQPPDWAFEGAWLEIEGGEAALRSGLDASLKAGAKVSVLYVRDWCGSKSAPDWSWDRALYPRLPKTIAALRERGIRFIGYISPFLDPAGSLYPEASAKGYCVRNPAGQDYLVAGPGGAAAMVDLTRGEAFDWMKAVIRRELIGIGMSGWVADAGECLPADAVLASGEDGAELHNRWPLLWARLNREAVEEEGLVGELLFFLRSGWLGSSRFSTAFWAGEGHEHCSRAGSLARLVPAAISQGLSGGGFWHAGSGDSRWLELSAFMPFFRASLAGLALFARMSEIYAALKPYHLAVAAELIEEGLPPIRHPWTHYESDCQTRSLVYQYLYGRDLMVAPVLSPCAVLTSLYLPEDQWVHLWSSRNFRGGQVTIDSPEGYPAVFYRAASPFAPLFDALRRTNRRS